MKMICNKANKCKSEYCSHKVGHKKNKHCRGTVCYFKCINRKGKEVNCIPAPKPKQTVIEVKSCGNCLLFTETQDDYCNHYEKHVDYKPNTKPDYCRVKRILIVVEEEK